MKATELMIGDRVVDSTKCNVLFDGIGCADKNDNDRYVGIYNPIQKRRYNEHLSLLTPIPLTPEILEKNGWRQMAHCPIWERKDVCFAVEINDETCLYSGYEWEDYDIVFSTSSVHELQHALRLCGLNDEADNFKV